MHYSCTQIATVGVIGLNYYNRTVIITENPDRQTANQLIEQPSAVNTMKP